MSHGVLAENLSGSESAKSFVVSVPTMDMLARVANKWSQVYADASAYGTPMIPKLWKRPDVGHFMM